MVVNYSRDSEYHSQRNNALIPHSSCNATSMIMALKQAGAKLPESRFPSNRQPEDVLTAFLQSDLAAEKSRRLAPWAYDRITGESITPPHEIHCVMTWAVNHLMGRDIVSFREDWSLDDLVKALDRGCGVVVSGKFPYQGGTIDHVVSLAGYMKHQNRIDTLLIDDPYGDYQTGYRSHRGNDIPLPVARAREILKPTGKDLFWASIISHR